MKNHIRATALAAAALGLVSCGGGATQPQLIGEMPIPNNPTSFTFDISWVDQNGHYYIADRTNKAVSMFDTSSLANIAVITGGSTPFAGIGASSDKSGPDGIVGIPGTNLLYVGDVSSVKVVDTSLKTTTLNIPINPPGQGTPSGFRADEGCYDPDDKLMMFAHPGDATPFATWIDTTTNTIKAQYAFTGSAGLEQCVYDSGTKSFYLNNDGMPANPEGEVDIFLASSVMTGTPAVANVYPLGGCNPTGLALGPGKDMLVACTPDAGKPLTSLILDRTTGATKATLKLGGADQVAYDSVTNRYFLPMRYWVDGGVSIGGSAASSAYNANFAVVDASSYATITRIPCGRNTHSIAIDGAKHRAFVPHTSGNAVAPSPGISVYSTE